MQINPPIRFLLRPLSDDCILHVHVQTAIANLQSSSFSQAIILTLLRSWGRQGFLTHVRNVAAFYRAKRDVFEAAMRRHLHDIAEWNTPEAGMFFWHVISFPFFKRSTPRG